MTVRYFSENPIDADEVTLTGGEAHHLLRVMRATVGSGVTLFDGSGAEFVAEILKLDRTAVRLAVVERREIDRELPFYLEVGVALPKGDRQKWLVEKLTELGVTTLIPLITARSVVRPTDGTLDRLARGVVEASKQCGRNRLMRIGPPVDLAEHVVSSPPDSVCHLPALDNDRPLRRWLAHPSGTARIDGQLEEAQLKEGQLQEGQATQLAVGPEGGFTDAEVATAVAAGWTPTCLGRRTLRVETAAVALAAAIALR